VHGRAVAAGDRGRRSGLWIDGTWTAFPLDARRLFPPYRAPLNACVAPLGVGAVALRPKGGELPVVGVDVRPRLPPGHYTGLASLPGGLFGVEESAAPRLVPALLSGPG
ncbi:MAG: hypothetical protein ACREID_02470, partial [Planctomycetota bacterium]